MGEEENEYGTTIPTMAPIFLLRLLLLVVSTQAFVVVQPPRVVPVRLASTTDAVDEVQKDAEFHPTNTASTTPQLLASLWTSIAQATSMQKDESITVLYPNMQEKFTQRYLNLFMVHLDNCKDVCDFFGISTSLVPYLDQNKKVVGFTAKSHASPKSEDDDEYDFAYDPFWDDGTDFERLYDGIDDEYEDEDGPKKDIYPTIENKVPDDDEEIIDISKKWVKKICSDMGICPFTKGAERAGLPMGDVSYTVDRSSSMEDMYAAYWKQVVYLEENNEKDVSTILLITPEFCLDQIEVFDSFTTTLTQPLGPLEIENMIQLIFFHPEWSFRDGESRSGNQAGAANYARRSPWPMFNILRTKQVRTAQKGIPTGLVYKQNEKMMKSVGVQKLETMLRLRDWADIEDVKVNRREFDALKIAQDYQETGVIKSEDQSINYDSAPAANKVERHLVEQGDLVNVLLQALGKRLGKGGQTAGPLSGPETSATALASEVLIQELDRMSAALAANEETEKVESPVKVALEQTDGSTETEELKRAKESRMEDARKAIFDDLREAEDPSRRSSARGAEDESFFSGSGIPDRIEDGLFPEGGNPDSFY